MKRNIRVIQYGIGTTGLEMTTLIFEKKGTEIVGAISQSRNVGRDLGEVIGLDRPMGVKISNDADAVLSSVKADVVLHATVSYLPDAWIQIKKVIEAGMSVITIAGRMVYPPPTLAREVDVLAKAKGVTVLSVGVNPGFSLEILPLFLSGICRNITRIKVRRVVDLSKIRASFLRKVGIGMTENEFYEARAGGSILFLEGFAGEESMTMISDCFGWDLDMKLVAVKPVLATERIEAKNLTLEAGMVRAYSVGRSGTQDGREFIRYEVECGLGMDCEAKNIISIEGDPNITETLVVEGASGTAPLVVNNIPNVLNAKPGLVTLKDLPLAACLSRDPRDLIVNGTGLEEF